MNQHTALEIHNLCVTVQATGVQLLANISLTLLAGQRLTFVGESGSGKSILAQAIMGTLPAGLQASGQLRVWGVDTGGQRQRTQPLWGQHLTMLPQEPWLSLNPLSRLLPQLAEAAYYRRSPALQTVRWLEAQKLAQSSLARMDLSHAGGQFVHQISGGMAQRAALAATELCGAQLLLADEPTKGLDASLRHQVAQYLLASHHRALLTITHDIGLAAQLGGMLAVMREGQLIEYGATDQVLQTPQHDYTRELLAAQPLNWPPMVRARTTANNTPVVQGHHLSKAYGTRQLFSPTHISLQCGEILAIAGPSGCGKTTLGNMLLGLSRSDTGHVKRSPDYQYHQFQKLYQDPPAAFAPSISLQNALRDLVRLHGLDTQRIAPLMQQLKLAPALLNRKPADISGGELQRFALLRLILLQPAFIFADEPTSRLDPITQRDTMQLLCNTAAAQNCAVLLVTHDKDIAAKAAHRIQSIDFANG